MYKVKLSFPYPQWNILRQTPGNSGIWGDYQFFINEEVESCDFWFVFDHLLNDVEQVKCPAKNVVLLTGEPYSIKQYDSLFTKQFNHIITCQREIKHPSVTYLHQGHPYFVGARYRNNQYDLFTKSFDELMAIETIKKTKGISIITSDKQFTDGHKRRFDFTMGLKEYFGDAIDLFGRGVKDFEDKWDVLADYKYSIPIENCLEDDWMTEKLYDCFLAHTFPFYYGCPNVQKYFSPNAFLGIDINDLDKSKRIIEATLNDPEHYAKALPELIKAKVKYLENYNIFPLIVNFIEGKKWDLSLKSYQSKKLLNSVEEKLHSRVIKKVKNLYGRFYR